MKKEITILVNKLSSEVDNFNYAVFEDKHEQLINEVIQISEKFAIDFAEWMFINYPNQYKVYRYKEERGFYTTEKLLEMYKKTLE